MKRRRVVLTASLIAAGWTHLLCAADEKSIGDVQVISTTPLPGVGAPLSEVAAPVQVRSQRQIEQLQAVDLSDLLNKSVGGVYINDMQGSPFQPDVNYRGYTASPLLGTPQGLSLYMDGVRLNQPFGDVVSWDLIPKVAIASITLMPGSNPLFGLNTLGGALSVQTKDGRSNPGTSVQSYVGSYGRRSMELEHGGSNEQGLHWYVAGNLFKERGWRVASPSDVRQLFTKLGWKNSSTEVKLSLSHADNQLNGNGLQEKQLLANDYSSVYTKPDITNNRSTLFNAGLAHTLSDTLSFAGNAYYRTIDTSTYNGDINENSLSQAVYLASTAAADRAALTAAGYTNLPANETAANTPFPFLRCIAQALQNDEPGEKCTGLINRTQTHQRNYGASGQFTSLKEFGENLNTLVLGAGYDASRSSFLQSTQLGYLATDRSVIGINAFADGVTGGNVDGVPYDNRVDLQGKVSTRSVFAMNTFSIGRQWHLLASGRWNQTEVVNTDNITPSGINSLSGTHRFNRLNPAVGLSYVPNSQWNSYIGYNEGSRAPTAIELGCANPANPCRLPNALAGDPPLNQVVTKTIEAGTRVKLNQFVGVSAGVFRAVNEDDILFVASTASGSGYFKNFGKTRRQGVELGADVSVGQFTANANYTYLDATYQSNEQVNGAGNSSNNSAVAGSPGVDGNISIKPGDKIPLIPKHVFKLNTNYQVNKAWSVSGGMMAVAGVFARGNENNQHSPNAPFYLGEGKTAGFAVFNAGTRYKVDASLEVFAQVNNLFNRQYATGAQLGADGFTADGRFVARPFPANAAGDRPLVHSTFYAPGAPRIAWVGVKYSFN